MTKHMNRYRVTLDVRGRLVVVGIYAETPQAAHAEVVAMLNRDEVGADGRGDGLAIVHLQDLEVDPSGLWDSEERL